MGNSESKNIQQQAFNSDHPYFRDSKIVIAKDEPQKKSIQSRFKIQNQQYDQWYKIANGGSNKLSSEYLLLPEKSIYKHDQGLCGNTGTLTNTYPNYPYTLEQLIKQRQPQKKLFKQSQLWYVLYALSAAKHDLIGRTNKLGDIKPQNIFINEEGKIKIASQYSWPGQDPSFARALDLEKINYNGLLAPQDVNDLQRGCLQNDNNKQSQVFAIGATIISAGILNNFSSVYNYKNKTFNLQGFRDIKNSWAESERYSDIFKGIILNLVDSNPGQRLTDSQLWQFVSQYSTNILDKSQFVIVKVPPKIERAFESLRIKTY